MSSEQSEEKKILVLHIRRADCVFERLRAEVEAGKPDSPVHVYYDGELSLLIKSLYRSALRTVQEGVSSGPRIVSWAPHPMGKPPGPRVQALLDAREASQGESPPSHQSLSETSGELNFA